MATPSETVKTEPDAIKVEANPDSFPLSLDEFCARLSLTDKRVELIGGFHHTERAAGHNKDVEAAFKERFIAFTKLSA
jgi:hypothetical protein